MINAAFGNPTTYGLHSPDYCHHCGYRQDERCFMRHTHGNPDSIIGTWRADDGGVVTCHLNDWNETRTVRYNGAIVAFEVLAHDVDAIIEDTISGRVGIGSFITRNSNYAAMRMS